MPEAHPIVKCLIWDLDNTLWDGTLTEDGHVGIDDAVREVVRGLDARGVLQAVASRNDHDEAWTRLEKLGVAGYFVLPHINWGPKSQSVRRIAERLNFSLRTIAFIDDLPSERAEVEYHLPEVRCYPAEQARELLALPEFSPPVVTVDARRRRRMYQAGFERGKQRERFQGADEDFLRSLDLVMHIAEARDEEITRVEELTLRTSQMNATGVHYSDSVLRSLLSDEHHDVWVVSMSDRFGPHGAVGVMLIEKTARAWRIKLLATSCRVVSFGAGTVLLRWLTDAAARAGVHLVADFRRTERNRMMEVAYRFAGFATAQCPCLAALSPPEGTECLHLEPVRQAPPTTMRVVAPAPPDSGRTAEWLRAAAARGQHQQ
ncbi:HAD-IIIC family phosphatase [Streptomyces albipurpureus]|uniref:HAD-IIIC family phosphatase n=1 Tax=Streptomyces albipurpureus TaxID=2897419 RepID=A0ABT0UMU4_9ACTN|nr:HAD-IIIC family phosphatase [Streptomyces sp. CWNU-1]MCM2389944.1 HAD-IIIC family phosphatase [Streptomyces sp. CWNU-1]